MADVSLRLNQAKMIKVVGASTRQAAQRAANKTAQRASANVISAGRVQTGLMSQMVVRPDLSQGMYHRFTVRSRQDPKIVRYQEEGTRGSVARKGGTLRFRVGGKIVFAKRTRGITGAHFMRKAIQQLRASDYSR